MLMLSLFTDDLLAHIRSLLDSSDGKSFRLVCKTFHRVDALSRSHLRVLRPEFLPSLLLKFPAVHTLDFSACPRLDDATVVALIQAGDLAGWTARIRTLILKRASGLKSFGLEMLARACAQQLQAVDVSYCCGLGDRECQALSFAWRLTDLSLDKCSNVTDVGLAHIAVGCARLQTLSLRWCLEITDLGIDLLTKKCSHLQFLDISYLEVTSESLRSIASLQNLENLAMAGCSAVDDVGLHYLAGGCPYLKVLDVSRCEALTSFGLSAVIKGHYDLLQLNASHCMVEISHKLLRRFKDLKCLTLLRVDGVRISCPLVHAIVRNCKSLVQIGLSKCTGLTDAHVAQLVSGCNNLKTLNLACSDTITDAAIFAIADSCKQLSSLHLESCSLITERSLELLGYHCVSLTELDLTDCCGINDTALSYLSRCCKLRCLKIGLCAGISDEGLYYIASYCNKIQELDLYRCPGIQDNGFAALAVGCKKLKILNISYCNGITDRGMEHIGRLEELVRLEMRGLKAVSGTGLTALVVGCQKLAELDLKHCENIDDTGFWALAYYSKNLRQINLSCCRITDIGLCMVMSNLTCLQVAKLFHLSNVSTTGLEMALKAGCGRLKKVKLLSSRKLAFSPETLAALWASGCRIRWD